MTPPATNPEAQPERLTGLTLAEALANSKGRLVTRREMIESYKFGLPYDVRILDCISIEDALATDWEIVPGTKVDTDADGVDP